MGDLTSHLVIFMPIMEEDGDPATCALCFSAVAAAWQKRHYDWHINSGHLEDVDWAELRNFLGHED